jgi:Restriction alleviation protein Lar
MRFPELERMRDHLKNDLPEIKPCPFCGHPYIDLEGNRQATVVCRGCRAEGPPSSHVNSPYDAIREAVYKWNTRPY